MKYIRVVILTTASVAVLSLGIWLLMGWTIGQAFEPAIKEGGGLRQLVEVVEASAGSTVARGDERLKPREATVEGASEFYQTKPQALLQDKKYFETWHSALVIADASRKVDRQSGRWESSTTVTWIAPVQRLDGWGHAYCVSSNKEQVMVLSPGPQALSSLDCNSLKIAEEVVVRMPEARLNAIGSGALILFVNKSSQARTRPAF